MLHVSYVTRGPFQFEHGSMTISTNHALMKRRESRKDANWSNPNNEGSTLANGWNIDRNNLGTWVGERWSWRRYIITGMPLLKRMA